MDATPEPTRLNTLLDGFVRALEEEIEAVHDELERRGIGRAVAASGGHAVDSDAAGFSYDWTLPPGKYGIRPDDAVRVAAAGVETLGFVTRWDPKANAVRIGVGDWLGRMAGPAELRFDPTWLLEALVARLDHIGDEPEAYHTHTALGLLGARFPETGHRPATGGQAEGLNEGQVRALERILGSRTQLVWGPPGTGKTRLLGGAAAALAEEGPVLIVATTNVAVDEAARRAVARLGRSAVEDGRIVRVGAGSAATGDPDLSLEAAIERREARSPGRLTRLLRELEGELRIALPPAGTSLRGRYGTVLAAARQAGSPGSSSRAGLLAAAFQGAAARALAEAGVVLSTFARLTLRDDLWSLRFRTVLVDEASTAPLPYLFAAACLASDRAVAFGDFQQLPAVVASRTDEAVRWLSRDIFRQSGIVDPESGRALPDPRDDLCVMLTEQYRMVPAVRALVSDLFYGGRLVDAPEVTSRREVLAPLVLVDTMALEPVIERLEGSRANEVHLDVLIRLLELLARRGVHDVGVVTPYRLQSRRLYGRVRARLGRAAPTDLEIATIHRFQGREKQVVILDTVDAPPGSSWFLNEARNRDFPRLLNVALSRSRDSLILVGTSAGLARTLPGEALLVRAVASVRERGRVLDAGRLARDGGRLFDS